MPRLRLDLDILPSPAPDRPGLLMRDPFGYSDSVLIVPPGLAQLLAYLDGEHSERDLRLALVEATGDLRAGEAIDHLVRTLDEACFLDNGRFAERKADRHREFAEAPVRAPSHLGPGGYPADPAELRTEFAGYFRAQQAPSVDSTIGIAAPHVSPFGGWQCYASAYAAIPPSARDKIFVVLGTSHYGAPERFGLTRKPFVTPYGETRTASEIVDELERAAPAAVIPEDYCHAREHSIEFQVVFLQHLFGPDIRILPILVGPFARSLYQGGLPEDDEGVATMLDALSELHARRGRDLFWVLGVDMAHVGSRYGDPFVARSGSAEMAEIEQQDLARIAAIERADTQAYWDLVCANQDPLKWCGSAPFYTFSKAIGMAARSLQYGQWEIDDESVVTFAGMEFGEKTPG